MNKTTISLLIKRQVRENFNIYSVGLLVLLAFLFFMFLIIHQWKDSFSGAVQNGVFIIGLFIGGGVFSSAMFQEFSSPQSGIWLLSIPAKHSEKVIANIILSVVFFLPIYLLIFYLVDVSYLAITNKLNFENLLNPFKDDFYQFFFLYLIFNGIILLGSVIFNKNSFIKTLLGGVILALILDFINRAILGILIPEASIISSIAFDSFLFSHQGENIKVSLLENQDMLSSIFVRVVLPIAIWVTVWLKLKEKEI